MLCGAPKYDLVPPCILHGRGNGSPSGLGACLLHSIWKGRARPGVCEAVSYGRAIALLGRRERG